MPDPDSLPQDEGLPGKQRILRWIPIALAALAALLLFLGGTGTRIGLWTFGTGFTVFQSAAYVGIAAAVAAIALLIALRPRGVVFAILIVALAVGATAFFIPWQWRQMAKNAPPIHDITTDLGNPPEFVAVLPLRVRTRALNPAAYGGPAVAARQRAAYPDIEPVHLATTPAAAFTEALEAARTMDWEVISADSIEGRIEAVATVPWFGSKEDVVIRITEAGAGSRVDVRSVSRVGQGDAGTNARRIREYFEKLRS